MNAKYLGIVVGIALAVMLFIGGTAAEVTSNSNQPVSIIGGADGPTSTAVIGVYPFYRINTETNILYGYKTVNEMNQNTMKPGDTIHPTVITPYNARPGISDSSAEVTKDSNQIDGMEILKDTAEKWYPIATISGVYGFDYVKGKDMDTVIQQVDAPENSKTDKSEVFPNEYEIYINQNLVPREVIVKNSEDKLDEGQKANSYNSNSEQYVPSTDTADQKSEHPAVVISKSSTSFEETVKETVYQVPVLNVITNYLDIQITAMKGINKLVR